LRAEDLAACASHNIDVVVHDAQSLQLAVAQAKRRALRVWLKLDSGMHRAGFDPAAFEQADAHLRRIGGIGEVVHMSHFSSAGDPVVRTRQLKCFNRSHAVNVQALASTANSAALIASTDTHGEWVSPGIMLYGVNPLGSEPDLGLQPAMTLRSYVIAVRRVNAGDAVGYDGRWACVRESRIGTIGIGYADGYPQHSRNGTPICIRGRIVPLVGRVSMDSLTVDLTGHDDVEVGDSAILWGKEVPASVVAEHADTIPYDLFTSLTERVTREYVDSEAGTHRTDLPSESRDPSHARA
jgi:alanine racemase